MSSKEIEPGKTAFSDSERDQQDIVELLEALIVRAKEGEILSIAIVVSDGDETEDIVYGNARELLLGATRMVHKLNMGCDSIDAMQDDEPSSRN